jgi:hydroxyethylthiazole kinase-like uncharacterized protein yjeF
VIAGSDGMLGAAMLSSHGASRGGAGMVRLYSPGTAPDAFPPSEVVGRAVGQTGWAKDVLDEIDRSHAVVVGPGLDQDSETRTELRSLVVHAPLPLVIDASGLMLLLPEATEVLRDRPTPTVLTPHEGEFRRMGFGYGGDPFPFNPKDRLMGVRDAAETLGVTMLLKGPTTIVANPDGRALFVTSGSPALATAGTGDVLSGVIGAFLAAGVEPLEAAAAAAHVHGRAAALGLRRGLVATDLPELVARWLSDNLAVPK